MYNMCILLLDTMYRWTIAT